MQTQKIKSKTAAQQHAVVQPLLEKMIGIIDSPALKPFEVISILEGLPESDKHHFNAALRSIGDGLRLLREIKDRTAY